MALLTRFKKHGGFIQLWTLIEECSHEKRQSLVQLIFEEDPGWGCLMLKKLLTPSKLLQWPIETLRLILRHAKDEEACTIFCLATPQQQERFLSEFTSERKLFISENEQSLKGNSEALLTAFDSVLKLIKQLENRNLLNRDQVDPSLIIDDRLLS